MNIKDTIQKSITIEYYNTIGRKKVEEKINTVSDEIVDITDLLKELSTSDMSKRIIKYNGENLILASITFNESTALWELVFFKSRSTTLPFIYDASGKYRQIKLKDDEMLTEALCMLYDPVIKTFAMQRNVFATGTLGIESFFSHFVNYPIILQSIHSFEGNKTAIFRSSKIKKFKLHIRNVSSKSKNKDNNFTPIKQYNNGTSICKVIDSALDINSSVINVEFSMANSSNVLTLEDSDFDVFEDLMNNNNVKSLEIGYVPDEKSNMQITDFMDSRIHDTIIISYKKNSSVDFSEILEKMTEKLKENLYLKN